MLKFLRPRRSLIRWAAIAFAVCVAVILLLANEIAIRRTSVRLSAQLAAIRAAGEPTTTEEFLGPPLDDAANAAVPLGRAAAAAKKTLTALRTQFGADFLEETADPRSAAGAAKMVDADPAYETDLQAADAITGYRSLVQFADPFPNTVLNHVQEYREVVRLETLRARFLLASGRPDDACRLMLRQMRLARKWMAKEPFLISELVGVAVRAVSMIELNRCLQSARLTPQTHVAVETELADEKSIRDSFRSAYGTERLWGIRMHDMPDLQFMKNRMLGAWANHDVSTYLDLMDDVVRSLDAPLASADQDQFRMRFPNGLSRLTAPGTSMFITGATNICTARDRHLAMSRCLRIVNECRERRLAKPEWKDLRLPAEARLDPFNGQPLRLVVKPNGLLVYSVDADLKDDGGKVNGGRDRDAGFQPPETPKSVRQSKK